MVQALRKVITLPCSSSVEDRAALSKKYLAKTIKLFDSLWEPAVLAQFRNKTHVARKAWASYSHYLYNPNGNLNLWIMRYLVHQSLLTSFSYANLIVKPHVKLPDKNLKSVVASQQEQIDKQRKDFDEMKEEMQKVITLLQAAQKQQQPQEAKESKEESKEMVFDLSSEIAVTHVSMLKTGGGRVNMKIYAKDYFRRKFKKTPAGIAQKKLWLIAIRDELVQKQVDVKKETTAQLQSLGIPRRVAQLLKAM